MTLLFAADVSCLEDSGLFKSAYNAVSPSRREKADRLKIYGDKCLCLGVELLLRCGLEKIGADSAEEIFTDEHGKPFLKSGICFSFSHTGKYALCTISDKAVGCDAEEVRAINLRITRRLCPEERDDILSQNGIKAQTDRFFRYWVLKESFMKITGLGMRLPLDSFRISLENTVTVDCQSYKNIYRFREFSDIPGCKCAVCTENLTDEAVFEWVELDSLLNR